MDRILAKISTTVYPATWWEMKTLMIRLSVLSGLALLTLPGFANAQNPDGQPTDLRYGVGIDTGYNYRGNYFGAYGRGRASTAEEGMARGMSDIIRSRGQASIDYARAATESEKARRAYLENRNFAISSFVENRAIRDEYRERASNLRKEKLAAYIKSRQLQPLSSSEFYETTGEIDWPIGLMHPHDENGRKQVEALFKERAEKGSLSATEHIRLNKLLNDWVYHLGTHEADFSVNNMNEAVRFLRRLQMLIKGDF